MKNIALCALKTQKLKATLCVAFNFWVLVYDHIVTHLLFMELFAGLLTTVLGLAGAPGIAIDKVATDFLRGQIVRADVLEVRVDNAPNYQILLGNVDRIRVAGRGVYVLEFLRIDQVDLPALADIDTGDGVRWRPEHLGPGVVHHAPQPEGRLVRVARLAPGDPVRGCVDTGLLVLGEVVVGIARYVPRFE